MSEQNGVPPGSGGVVLWRCPGGCRKCAATQAHPGQIGPTSDGVCPADWKGEF